MKRREFLSFGFSLSTAYIGARALFAGRSAWAADKEAKKPGDKAAQEKKAGGIAEKDVLKEGQPATIANYCENPDKQPNKFCPDWKTKPGHCKECTFYNKDNSEATFKGKKFAHCQLLTDPKKPQFVSENAYCATFVKKS